jgi:Ras-related GTP-binding protein C/D
MPHRTLKKDKPSSGVGADEEGEEGEASQTDGASVADSQAGWWDDEDPDAPWMTQSTRLMPNTTIALWQFTP